MTCSDSAVTPCSISTADPTTPPEHVDLPSICATPSRSSNTEKSPTPLEMSVGIASGVIYGFLAGEDSKELLFVGPTASEVVRLQDAASPGEILTSMTTVDQVGEEFFGTHREGGRVLEDDPDPEDAPLPDELGFRSQIDLASFLPSRLRDHASLAFNDGEHRPATVAFVRFTGTDALFSAGTPETVAETLNELVATVQDLAHRNGVTFLASDVNRDGGKLILTTGVPDRSEGHAERMIRALRGIVDANPPLPVHIEVARGHIFAGDLGARFRRVYTVMGDSVNLAARLASQAGPGEILATARALDLSDSGWDTTQLAPIELKGKSKPVAPFSIGSMVEIEGARHGPTLELVGREPELEQLTSLVDGARSGTGAVINLTGQAGVGKTRIVEEVTERLAATFEIAYVDSEQYEAATPYFGAGRLLRSLLDLKPRQPEEIGQDLAHLIEAEYPDLVPWMPLLGDVIQAVVASTPEVDALAAEFREPKLRETVVSLLIARLTGPTMIVIDDVHWLDDSSRAVLEALGMIAGDRPWALVFVGRSEHNAGVSLPNAETITLEPLSDEEALHLISHAAKTHVPLPIAEAIVQRSGGNPFFLVELARSGVNLEQTDLPETIEAVTLASIDRLEPRDRRLLRTASVFGERFALDLVADAVSDVGPLVEDMTAWSRLDDFLEIGATGRVRFRQAIVRDVAYEGLSFRRRRELHAAVGAAIEQRARRRPERYAELLSLHFDRAEEWSKSWSYSTMAGDSAVKKHAGAEAITLYGRSLRAAEHLGGVDETELIRVTEALGDAADLVGLYDEAEQGYDRAFELAADRIDATGRLLRKKGFVQIKRGELAEASRLLIASLEVLDSDETPAVRAEHLETEIAVAGHHFRRGEYEDTVAWCGEALALAGDDPDLERSVAHAYSLRSAAYTHLNGMDGTEDARRALAVFERVRRSGRAGRRAEQPRLRRLFQRGLGYCHRAVVCLGGGPGDGR